MYRDHRENNFDYIGILFLRAKSYQILFRGSLFIMYRIYLTGSEHS